MSADQAAQAPPRVPTISFRAVERVYPGPPPVPAVSGVDLTIDNGEYVAITGPSGSGKSTLLNLIGLLDRPTGGCYRIDGSDVASWSDAERTAVRGQRIGFVFQDFHLMPYRSAVENVMIAQLYGGVGRAERRRSASRTLHRVGLGHRLNAMPTTLSGGERQRVAIARALVNRPRLLLCDEPTGNLDSSTTSTILELLEELHGEGQTVVVITHDPAVAMRARRVITIRDGRVGDRDAR